MYEAIEHGKTRDGQSYTIFRGKDAEGRKCYDWTLDRDGCQVEPDGCGHLCSLTETRKQAKETE